MFMGTVCGDLLSPCVCGIAYARFSWSKGFRVGRCDLDFGRDGDWEIEGNGGDPDGGAGAASGVGFVQDDDVPGELVHQGGGLWVACG